MLRPAGFPNTALRRIMNRDANAPEAMNKTFIASGALSVCIRFRLLPLKALISNIHI